MQSDENFIISPETIEAFINFVQGKKIVVNKSNVVELNYLSNEYEVPILIKETKEYIENHQEELVLEILIEKQNKHGIFNNIDVQTYEEIISSKFNKYIDDPRLIKLNVPTLYRILEKYDAKNDEKTEEKIFNFLTECVSKYGKESSILFDKITFRNNCRKYVKILIDQYSNQFDFSCISKMMINSINEYEAEIKFKEESYNDKFSKKIKEMDDMKTKYERELLQKIDDFLKEKKILEEETQQQKDRTTKMKEDYEKKILQFQNQVKMTNENKEKLEKEISNLREELKAKEILYSKEIEKQKTIIQKKKDEIDNKIKAIKKQQEENIGIPLLYRKNDEFNGIINYLTHKTGRNIHDNGTIEVTSNSFCSSCEPKNLLNFNDSSFYEAEQTNNAWIKFDFKSKKIKIKNYSIKSYGSDKNSGHLKSWDIEISNDGQNWKKIDERKNCQTLNGRNLIGTFDVSSNDFSRYIRLYQTDNPWGGDWWVWFNSIEFYGYLKE